MASRNFYPAYIYESVVKWVSWSSPLSAPQNEASSVNIFGIFNSLYIDMRAVPSFDLFNENLDYSKEKKSQSFDRIYGNTLVECGASLMLFPYMNIFFRREWPWKSQNNTISLSFIKDRIIRLTPNTTGWRTLFGFFHLRLRSYPQREHL